MKRQNAICWAIGGWAVGVVIGALLVGWPTPPASFMLLASGVVYVGLLTLVTVKRGKA